MAFVTGCSAVASSSNDTFWMMALTFIFILHFAVFFLSVDIASCLLPYDFYVVDGDRRNARDVCHKAIRANIIIMIIIDELWPHWDSRWQNGRNGNTLTISKCMYIKFDTWFKRYLKRKRASFMPWNMAMVHTRHPIDSTDNGWGATSNMFVFSEST